MKSNISTYQNAVEIIKTAILQSQARAAKAINQEQLSLYYGIGRYVSENTRNKKWGDGAIEVISNLLRQELPGLRGFSARSIRNMRAFYEEWRIIETHNFADTSAKINNSSLPFSDSEIHQLELVNLPDFPLKEFLSISFSHHIAILTKAKAYEERVFYIKYADTQLSSYLRILNDDDRHAHEEAPIGIILCKNADKTYAEYIMQDFRQPMGVATYKTVDEINPELLKVLPPKEELQRLFDEYNKKEDKK